MTAPAPTWAELRQFLEADRWTQLPPNAKGGSQTDHIHFEKVTPDGLLQTQISHASQKRPSPGRFSGILRYQLKVSKKEFWEAIRTGRPADRPVASAEPDPSAKYAAWAVEILKNKLHLSETEIHALAPERVVELAQDYFARPKS